MANDNSITNSIKLVKKGYNCEDKIYGKIFPKGNCSVSGIKILIQNDDDITIGTATANSNGEYTLSGGPYPCGKYTATLVTSSIPACYSNGGGFVGPLDFELDGEGEADRANFTSIEVNFQSADGGRILYTDCNYRTPINSLFVNVLSVEGGTSDYTIEGSPNTFVSHTNIEEGEGFTFYFTKASQTDSVYFTINGTEYRSSDFIPQLRFLDIDVCITPEFQCKDDITHNLGAIGVTDYNAKNSILSSGIVQTESTINYYAGSAIDLKEGFEVEPDANFTAAIEDCP